MVEVSQEAQEIRWVGWAMCCSLVTPSIWMVMDNMSKVTCSECKEERTIRQVARVLEGRPLDLCNWCAHGVTIPSECEECRVK